MGILFIVMKLILQVVLALSVIAYTVEFIRGNKIDSRIEPEYTTLQMLYKIGCSKTPPRHSIFISKLKDSERGVVGVCLKGLFRDTIIIDEDFFNLGDKNYVEATLAHELSHCFLGLSHRNTAGSYMNENVPSQLSRIRLYAEFLLDVRENCN